MIGIEQAGIAETMDFVLKKFDAETQNKLAQVQYLHLPIMKNNVAKIIFFPYYPLKYSTMYM